MSTEEYLTIDEVAARIKLSPKTIKNKMGSGIFRKDVHYFSPRSLRPRFKWSAVQTLFPKRYGTWLFFGKTLIRLGQGKSPCWAIRKFRIIVPYNVFLANGAYSGQFSHAFPKSKMPV